MLWAPSGIAAPARACPPAFPAGPVQELVQLAQRAVRVEIEASRSLPYVHLLRRGLEHPGVLHAGQVGQRAELARRWPRSRRSRPRSPACRRTGRGPAPARRPCPSGTCRSRRAPRSPSAAPSSRSSPSRMRHSRKRQAASVSLSVSKRMPSGSSLRRTLLGFDSEPLCTRQKSSPAVNGCARSGVTADSVAMRVWPTRCVPAEVREVVARGDLGRRADVLVEVDAAPGRQQVQLRVVRLEPAP